MLCDLRKKLKVSKVLSLAFSAVDFGIQKAGYLVGITQDGPPLSVLHNLIICFKFYNNNTMQDTENLLAKNPLDLTFFNSEQIRFVYHPSLSGTHCMKSLSANLQFVTTCETLCQRTCHFSETMSFPHARPTFIVDVHIQLWGGKRILSNSTH